MKSCAGRLRAVAVAKGPSQHEGKSGNEKFETREAPLERTGLGYRPDCSWSNVRAAEVCPSSANRHWLLRRTTQPANTVGCAVLPNCIPAVWSTTSNAATDISAPIAANF